MDKAPLSPRAADRNDREGPAAAPVKGLAPRAPLRPAGCKVVTLFGTRPEIIKLAPVMHQLADRPHQLQAVNVASGSGSATHSSRAWSKAPGHSAA